MPEAVAFAFVAGVHPLVGLYAAFLVRLVTALIGGRPGMISGATGALAVVMVALVAKHGVEYLFATVALMGLLQIFAGGLCPGASSSGSCRTRIAGIAAALFLLSFILFASPLIEMIPLAALVGVMFMVVIGTFAWNSVKILFRVPKSDVS